jgi:hypothetical protein
MFLEPIVERYLQNFNKYKETDNKETDYKETDYKETDNKETDNKETDNKEFSYNKFFTRSLFFLLSILYSFLSQSSSTLFIYTYFTGYFFISALIQFYSLQHENSLIRKVIKIFNKDSIFSRN